jgi:hypothetical protein
MMIHALLWGLLPAVLILWIGSRIRTSKFEDIGVARWLRFLLGVLALLLPILIVATNLNNQTTSFVWMALLPVTCGIVASISLHFFSNRKVWLDGSNKTVLLFLINILLLVLLGISGDLTMPFHITIGGVFLALVWQMWNWIGRKVLTIWATQIILMCISIWATDTNTSLIESPDWLSVIVQMAVLVLIPIMGITIAASMVYDLLTRSQSRDWRRVVFISSLIISIFFLIGYQISLASAWDVATDGLGGIFLWMTSSVAAVAIAMVMAWFVPRERKLITLFFAIIVPLSMRYALWMGSHIPDGQWGESPTYITELRAERVAQAIQNYYEDRGSYPQSLNDLFPRNMIHIPRPMMIPGLTWCYESGQDFYRFGYVYRQYFSTPASVVIYAASGTPPDPYWSCDDEAAKYPPPPGYYNP